MKVCLLNDSFPPVIDGVSNAVVNYARVIQKDLGSCVVATPEYPEAEDHFDFPVLRYPSLNTTKLVGYRTGLPFDLETLFRLTEGKPDLIHSHCPVSSTLLGRRLRDVTGAPLVMTYHTKFDIDIRNAIHGHLLQEAAVKLLVNNIEACDEVWTVSRGAGENLESLGYTGSWRVMPNGVDLPRGRAEEQAIRDATAGYDLPAGLPVFLFVGRLMWYKGIRLILDGLRQYLEGGKDFRMVFIGSGGDEKEIRAYAAECGLGDRTVFTGPIRDRETLRAWYSFADLLLFPSTFDTNGLVVREAAACALPALLVADSCAAEGVEDGVNGVLIGETAESLENALRRLDREKLREIGLHAQEELYISWEESVRRAWERYGEILEERNSGRSGRRAIRPVEEMFDSLQELKEALDRAKERLEDNRLHTEIRSIIAKRSEKE